ncbi:hypothetical protein SJS77_21255, partial [Aeromonas caviae]|nr:hypothetical protein [Aeromonas caviae]
PPPAPGPPPPILLFSPKKPKHPREGVDSYLAVLDAQRLLFSSQQQLVLNQLAQLNSEIDLYRALGGGWHTASVAPAAASADPEA